MPVTEYCCFLFGAIFSARCNIYISRLYYDVSVRLSARLSVTGRIVANLGFKFRSKFTRIVVAGRGNLKNNISCYASHCQALLLSYANGQTNKQRDILITILRTPPGGEVKIINKT